MAGSFTKGTEIDRIRESEGELESEEAIMNDKERFGRVRTTLMKQLRAKYGNEVANRALYRINKRISEGSLRIKSNLSSIYNAKNDI